MLKDNTKKKSKGFNHYYNYVGEINSVQINKLFNHITGQILTIIDAAISDEKQNTAIKDLIKNKIWDNYEPLQNWLYHQERVKSGKDKTGGVCIFPF